MRLFFKPGQQQWISRFVISILICCFAHYTFCFAHYTFCLKVPYNVERMVLMACGLDTERVGVLMKEFYAETKTSIPEDILNIIRGVVVDSKCVHNEEMIETLARC